MTDKKIEESHYEDRLDALFKGVFTKNHPAMEDWVMVKLELKRLRNPNHIQQLESTINDLTLSLSLWIDGYPFDDDHRSKQKQMIDNACVLIGKPRTIEELKKMMGFE